MRWFITLSLLVGCAGKEVHLPHQEIAMKVVWNNTYGHTTMTPPRVRWVFDDELNCDSGAGFIIDGGCKYGYFDGTFIMVAYPSYYLNGWWPEDFAHELYHAHLFHTYGDGDSDHSGCGWENNSCSKINGVDAATKALIDLFDYPNKYY